MTHSSPIGSAVEPFEISIPDAALEELHQRLRQTRWPIGVTDSSGGFPLAEAKRLATYWSEEFDWRSAERSLNRTPQYVSEVETIRIHFVRLSSRRENTSPLLLLHGWPGSFVELLGIAEMLQADHDVVVPSIPGFGFSSAANAPGLSNRTIAGLFVQLMARLGYDRFAVHGGDIGAGIGSWMAALHPDHVTALHLNFIPGSYAPSSNPPPNDEERAFFARRREWSDSAGAYAHLQRTRPLTLAYGLSDSPAGVLAWIAEKFMEWSDPRSTVSADTILTNVSVYWFTNTIASSVRIYLESSQTPLALDGIRRIEVPTAVAVFPYELPLPPRSWVERGYNVVRWTSMSAGGHFAALENPNALASDIREFLSFVS
jgi:pimeloyl-ACP methyl ester carboxylesterase